MNLNNFNFTKYSDFNHKKVSHLVSSRKTIKRIKGSHLTSDVCGQWWWIDQWARARGSPIHEVYLPSVGMCVITTHLHTHTPTLRKSLVDRKHPPNYISITKYVNIGLIMMEVGLRPMHGGHDTSGPGSLLPGYSLVLTYRSNNLLFFCISTL